MKLLTDQTNCQKDHHKTIFKFLLFSRKRCSSYILCYLFIFTFHFPQSRSSYERGTRLGWTLNWVLELKDPGVIQDQIMLPQRACLQDHCWVLRTELLQLKDHKLNEARWRCLDHSWVLRTELLQLKYQNLNEVPWKCLDHSWVLWAELLQLKD